MRLALLLSSLVAIVCACGSSDDDATPNAGNGVNDVKIACETRAAWTRAKEPSCTSCNVTAPVAKCGCKAIDDDPHVERCLAQAKARTAEADCTREVTDCVYECKLDCACEDACYVGHDACRAVTAAVDGCRTAECDVECK
jgi:hypothetical protein